LSEKDEKRPIILVKKIKKAGGHHGGAWKVAYADFVTAMMAFFMVMWLIASVNKETRAAIFDYFKNPSMEKGNSPKAAPGQMGPGGASTSVINMRGGLDARKSSSPLSTGLGTPTNGMTDHPTMSRLPSGSAEEAKKQAAEAERQKLESLMAELKAAIGKSQALAPYKDQLLLDVTPEGLRIQVVDAQNRPMFDLGSSQLKSYSSDIMKSLAPYLNTVPNHISLAGHTDTTPFVAQGGYNNWDLSTDRANAARRALESGGLEPGKVSRVVGLSSSVLFDKENARDPINRRISIIVMTQEAEASALKTDTATEIPVETATEALRKVEGATDASAPAGAGGEPAAQGASTAAATSAGSAAAAASAPPTPAIRAAPALMQAGGSGTPDSIPIIQITERDPPPAR
jgi:chemotaxis protein MotB